MWEQHGRGIRWDTRLPANWGAEEVRIEVQQYQVVAAGKEPVCRQVNLLRCRKMNETHVGKRRRSELTYCGGGRPLLGCTEMDKFSARSHTTSLPQPQRGGA